MPNLRTPVFLLSLLCLLGASQALLAQQASDRILIKFKQEARNELRDRSPVEALSHLKQRLNLPAGYELRESRLARVQRTRDPRPLAERKATLDIDRYLRLQLPAGTRVEEALQRVRGHALVDYAEPDGIGSGGATIPNDPSFNSQWHHRNGLKSSATIHTPEAWDLTVGSSNVVVAVLDTGLKLDLTEFAGRIVAGYDFVNEDADPTDDHGHGTAVAGAVCANGNNNTLVAGVDWRCKVMPIKVLDFENLGFYSDWADGIDFAVSNGCKIINLSAGGSGENTTVRRAITNAIARGVIFVTISHNDSTNSVRFPGRMLEAITAGATDQQDRRWSYSNYGPSVDLVAPGVNIATVSPNGTVAVWSGTSFAAPLVSGTCALLAALRPDLNQQQAVQLLTLGAEDQVGEVNDVAGFDNYYGWGRLNAYNSLLLARARIDSWQRSTNAQASFAWMTPSNAFGKQPYRVEFAGSVTGQWTDVTANGQFQFSGARGSWTRSAAAPPGFYRLRIRSVP